jgi:hypothetical protein
VLGHALFDLSRCQRLDPFAHPPSIAERGGEAAALVGMTRATPLTLRVNLSTYRA